MQGHPFSFLTSHAPITVSFLLAFPADPHACASGGWPTYNWAHLGHLTISRLVRCCPAPQLVRYASDCKNARKLTEHMQWYVLLCKGLLPEDYSSKPPQLRGCKWQRKFPPPASIPARDDGIHPTDHCGCEVAKEAAGGSLDEAAFPTHVAALLPGPAGQFAPREGASEN
ncbi:hypothetical protein ASPBRDRAFT_54280 [Aspergillus brasiliensis CBS 101740]|uniref:Uncharacterized protein n=1 Tax=Aspergillus brasiliensis (strain CBS 101740 / IMI 381727 / IBT 21946) TaxID=767769 RepID=A0A1L9ULA3_ASPBC|nr:hypothetical protein ASPBRDRAFT_54280 [Aspergillus brasiliensis CBS 101740]